MAEKGDRDAVITGIGLVSPIADGIDAHVERLTGTAQVRPPVDAETYAPFPVHPLTEIDLSVQIPRRGDQRQMENWQRYGTYAAGLALTDAGIAGQTEYLERTSLIVAAGGGERDATVDGDIVEGWRDAKDPGAFLNERLGSDLRPTLFLAQLSNLLAGNISIVHHVTGSSRTFMGEELGGATSLETAWRQIRAGQNDLFLVGGAYNAVRYDMVVFLAMSGLLWAGADVPEVWHRTGQDGGMVMGSVGAFLVLESRSHAEARGARIHARLDDVVTDRGARDGSDRYHARIDRQIARLDAAVGETSLGILSGTSGVPDALAREREMLEAIAAKRPTFLRGTGTVTGHAMEAQMPAGVGLAAAALSNRTFYQPFGDPAIEAAASEAPEKIAVTGWGAWRGESLAVLSADS
ncbi:beta-ketoacyl-ACP synthase [Amorphus orientalis]|uniref:3-oxoacyl-[acyl-carrier-protein] synthase II n=1 Tax=Amorphus orientalis TaxID=649198 RepID=A0AAE3VRU3_9HYPH|nr:beta-ketoacyl-ACP synthase [Amorphus orientalis]MDQ0316506.1 3-oxoacyl-[acyl-carrier-protein] synthase II [Amorphus orientalis]